MLCAVKSRPVWLLKSGILLVAAVLMLNLGGCPTTNPDGSGSGGGTDTGGGSGGGTDTGGGSGGGTDTGGGDSGGGTDTGGGDSGGGTDTGGGGSGGGSDTGGGGDDTGGGGGTGGGGDDVGGGTTLPPTAITLQQIVQSGDPVPDQPGAYFNSFGSPIIDADGRVAFWGLFTGGGGRGGLYVWENSTLRRVVDDDPSRAGTVPGGAAAEYFGLYQASGDYDPLLEPITWGSNGRLLFTSRITGGSGRTGLFRWRASDKDTILVADSNMIAAGLGFAIGAGSQASFISTFGNHGVSDAGFALFRTSFTYIKAGSGFTTGTAVCISDGTKVTPIVPADVDQIDEPPPGNVPDQAASGFPNAYFTEFRPLTTLSPGGYMLFQGRYTQGTGNRGIYLSVNGAAAARVLDNRPTISLPGLPAEARIGADGQYYKAMAISTNNHIAVETPITAGGATRNAVIVWDWTLKTWAELKAGDGTAATALLSGISDGGAVVALVGGVPHVLDRSAAVNITTVLPAALSGVSVTWANAGGAINNLGHAVVPYTRPDGAPGLAFWTNDELLVLADPAASLPVVSITEILASSLPETDRPGRSGVLNDKDQAVFRTKTGGGTQAIYMGTAQ